MAKKREVGLPKVSVSGKGSFNPPSPQPLLCASKINEYVGWTENNVFLAGLLENWEGNIAVINVNGTVKRVECTKH